MPGHRNRNVEFTIRIQNSKKRTDYRELEGYCAGADWELTWSEFMEKHFSLKLDCHHRIKSSKGTIFTRNDKVKEFLKEFTRKVLQCHVYIVIYKKSDITTETSGSSLSRTRKESFVSAQPAPMTPQPNGHDNNDEVEIIGNLRERVSKFNVPGTSGSSSNLRSNSFKPNLGLSSSIYNDRKYLDESVFQSGHSNRENGKIHFDDASSVCDSIASQGDETPLPYICTSILKKLLQGGPDSELNKMRREHANGYTKEPERMLKWQSRYPVTNSFLNNLFNLPGNHVN